MVRNKKVVLFDKIDLENNEGKTALLIGVDNIDALDTIKLLNERGANPDIRVSDQSTALIRYSE